MRTWRLLLVITLFALGVVTPASTLVQAASTVPGAPTNVHAIGHTQGQATVTWQDPIFKGSEPITIHYITAYSGYSSSVVRTAGISVGTIAMLGGLPSGSYTFGVKAANKYGTGPESLRSNLVTVGALPSPPVVRLPGPPLGLGVAVSSQTAILTWSAPNVNADVVAGYQVTVYEFQIGTNSWLAVGYPHVQLNLATMATITGLTNGLQYRFTVTATSASGLGAESQPTMTVVPTTQLPAGPPNASAGVSSGILNLTWTTPFSVVVDHYLIVVYRSNGTLIRYLDGVHANSATIGDLGVGTYIIQIRVVDALGRMSTGTWVQTQLPGIPDAPYGVTASLLNGQVVVSWTAPYNGGSSINYYYVSALVGTTDVVAISKQVAGTVTSAVFTGLDASRQYTFIVNAVNSNGWSASSQRSALVTLSTVPGTVQNLRVTPASESVTATWSAPLSNGGMAITGYQVTAWDGVHSATVVAVAGTSVTLTGLSNGVTYTVSVIAVNAIGLGTPVSATAIPINHPPVLTVPGNQTLTFGGTTSLAISATGPEATDHLVFTASGLPSGLTFTDQGNGTGTITGTVNAPAGVYPVTVSVNDGHNAVVTQMLSISVNRAILSVVPASSNPMHLTVKSASSTKAVPIAAQIGAAGPQPVPVTFTLKPMGTGITYQHSFTITANSGAQSLMAIFRNLTPGVYRVIVHVESAYYQGDAYSLFTIRTPALLGTVTGSGNVVSSNGASATFSYKVTHTASGVHGAFTYIEYHEAGNVTVKGTVGDLVVRGHRAYFQGSGTMNGVPGYRFSVAAIDNVMTTGIDRLALWMIGPNHNQIGGCTFSSTVITNGDNVVKVG